MTITVNDIEKSVNSALTTTIKKSEVKFNQLFIDVDVENLISVILFLFQIQNLFFFLSFLN